MERNHRVINSKIFFMRAIFFQLIASGVALGLMGGSVAVHSLHVSGAKDLSESQEWSGGGGASSSRGSGSVIAPAGVVDLGPALRRQAQMNPNSTEGATVRALQKIMERLQELHTANQSMQAQNDRLLEQLAETNRDLMELQFRVDTHSQGFRPMPLSSGSLLDGQRDRGPSHPLLPPKR